MTRGRNFTIGLTLLLCSGIGIGCQAKAPTRRPLTDDEVQTYVAEHELTPVAITQRQNTTYILFDNGKSAGYATASSDENGAPVDSMIGMSSREGTEFAKVLGVMSGDAFIAIIIRDDTSAKQVHSVEVTFQDGYQVKIDTQGQRGILIHDKAAATHWETITFYSTTKEIIHQLD